MKKKLSIKPFVNKKNGQIILYPKKSQLPKELVDKIFDIKHLKLTLEDWD